ncbi:MAG TPA: hypothetical protein VG125_28440 [Pirellulales bacterium]|jgi:hypothetical protein|nr:hypothetical protein [Pirellulales bacterium]
MPNRRWFQFSLRALLVALTALGVWLGFKAEKAHRQRDAVRAIEKLGGVVRYGWQPEVSAWWSDVAGIVRLVPSDTGPALGWPATLLGSDWFYDVKEVVLTRFEMFYRRDGQKYERVSENGPLLKTIDPLDQIDRLTEHLRRLPGLQKVHVEFPPTNLPDHHPAQVAKLRAALPNCEVTVDENFSLRPIDTETASRLALPRAATISN